MPVELLSAMAYDAATFDDQGYPDPVLKVEGELPGMSLPFHINRVYKGAQGRYEESVLILDGDDVVVWQRPWRLVSLRGEMFEDLFRDTITSRIEIANPDEHQLVFLLDGGEVGRVPLFIDAQDSAKALGVEVDAAEASLKKGSVAWVTIPQPDGGEATRPIWYVQKGRELFLIKGGGEMELPNIEHATRVDVTVRSKDDRSAIAVLPAAVRVVANDSDEFEAIATLGMGTRLNLQDGQDALQRWTDNATMVALDLASA